MEAKQKVDEWLDATLKKGFLRTPRRLSTHVQQEESEKLPEMIESSLSLMEKQHDEEEADEENLFLNKTRSDFGDVYTLSKRYSHYPRPGPYVLKFEWLKEVEYGNQKILDFGCKRKDLDKTKETIFFVDPLLLGEIVLHSSDQREFQSETTWRMSLSLSWIQRTQDQKKWPTEAQVIKDFPKEICLGHLREKFAGLEDCRFFWLPGGHFS
ncbi:hypothetical protein DY000_02009811 [Brassica cretica]|uniref:Uncharacterized protein n=1 Tax=Brassica cretica TaxID=69181 RepID=A0ABQ7C8Y6_BRACR|nr:hypothetical protein DY000_02009811 [Brassica cretica]